MESKTLHITCTDINTEILEKNNITGNKITWREMLCEGKTTTDVGSENFWKTRFDFLKSNYKITKKKFIDLTLKEYRNLCQQKQQDEIVLWLDYDLYSQVNMLAVLSWLKRYRPNRKLTIVQSSKIGGAKKVKKISELTSTQLKSLYENRVELSIDDIEYADYIWQLYCSASPLRLEKVHKFNPMSSFVYLEEALANHLKRFPSITNGLNVIENNILNTANTNTYTQKDILISELIKNHTSTGFNVIQFEKKLQFLKKLFTSFDPVKLSRKGKQVLENELNFYGQIRNENLFLGGAKKYSFLYIHTDSKLLKITS